MTEPTGPTAVQPAQARPKKDYTNHKKWAKVIGGIVVVGALGYFATKGILLEREFSAHKKATDAKIVLLEKETKDAKAGFEMLANLLGTEVKDRKESVPVVSAKDLEDKNLSVDLAAGKSPKANQAFPKFVNGKKTETKLVNGVVVQTGLKELEDMGCPVVKTGEAAITFERAVCKDNEAIEKVCKAAKDKDRNVDVDYCVSGAISRLTGTLAEEIKKVAYSAYKFYQWIMADGKCQGEQMVTVEDASGVKRAYYVAIPQAKEDCPSGKKNVTTVEPEEESKKPKGLIQGEGS